MPSATLTDNGQITLPQPVLDRLRLKAGDRVDFVFDEAGQVVMKSRRIPFEELIGSVKSRRKKPLSLREMDEIIAAAAVNRFLKAVGRPKAKKK